MGTELRAIQVVSDKKQYIVVPEKGDMGYLVIMGVFLEETIEGKLDELSFLPVNRELTGIEIPVSALKKANCPVEIIPEAKIEINE